MHVKLRNALICFLLVTTVMPLLSVVWFAGGLFDAADTMPLIVVSMAYLATMGIGWVFIGRIADPLEEFASTLWHLREKGTLKEIRPDLAGVNIVEFHQVLNAYNDLAAEVRRSHEKLSDHAMRDTVTGIGNRQYFEAASATQILQRTGKGSRGILFFIDLDNFKTMNDTHGHAVGDGVLCQIARQLYPATKKLLDEKFKGTTATHPVVARIGGDEFAILLPIGDALTDLDTFCSALHAAFPSSVTVNNLDIQCRYSVGAAVYPQDGLDVATLMRRADEALYRVKRAGRGKAALYGAQSVLGGGSEIRAALVQALSAGELCLEYQPKYCLAEKAITGVEALIRWNHPVYGKIAPGVFLPAVKNTAQIAEIGDWVVRQALSDAVLFKQSGFDLCVSVNIDAAHFNHRDFVASIIAHCSASRLATNKLQIEITEDVMECADGAFQKNAAMLRAAGVQLAIDDFGRGYSNLSRMASIEVDVVKLDRTMIWDAVNDPRCKSVLVAAVDMAHALNCTTVVEGVENERHVNIATQAGADVLQGYYLTRSLSTSALLGWLEERRGAPLEKSCRDIEKRLRII